MTGPTGIVVVDKPGGLTSHAVVARARRALGTRKIGHAGTLDPMATGVLVLGVGRATRLLGHLTLTEKRYEATIRLGAATTTDDAEGEVTATAPVGDVTEETVRAALEPMRGEIDQVPSTVSAIKVDGRRAYARARAGEEVELAARRVRIFDLEVEGLDTGEEWLDVRVRVHCSSGTYVRAIARDLGAALGVGGHLTALRRTAVGPFDLVAARSLEEVEQDATLLPIADAARACFPATELDADQTRAVRHGRALDLVLAGDDRAHALFAPDGEFLALYAPDPADPRTASAVAVFVG